LKASLNKKNKEIDNWESKYVETKETLEKSENTKNDLEIVIK
jgi:hypothetical protein